MFAVVETATNISNSLAESIDTVGLGNQTVRISVTGVPGLAIPIALVFVGIIVILNIHAYAIDPEKTNSFLRKLRALQRTDPAKLIPLIMDSGAESIPGCVEFNIARALETSVNQVRAWCAQSSDFRKAVNILSTSQTTELLAKLEEGEFSAASSSID
jgi:hypothetical protein